MKLEIVKELQILRLREKKRENKVLNIIKKCLSLNKFGDLNSRFIEFVQVRSHISTGLASNKVFTYFSSHWANHVHFKWKKKFITAKNCHWNKKSSEKNGQKNCSKLPFVLSYLVRKKKRKKRNPTITTEKEKKINKKWTWLRSFSRFWMRCQTISACAI